MDLGILGQIHLTWVFLVGFLSIVLIDLVLAGDNAVVIAMAVRSLPRDQRLKGIALGAGAAVILRVIVTFFAARLMQIQFIKFIGGAMIVWIALKLFIEGARKDEIEKEPKTLMKAVWVIIIADLTMSTDNILAVAGASGGNLFLLLFGLGLSIPFIVFTSNLLSLLIDRYPFMVYLGAAVLGRVAGEMMITDTYIVKLLHPSKIFTYGIEFFFAISVLAAGKIWIGWNNAHEEKTGESDLLNKPSRSFMED